MALSGQAKTTGMTSTSFNAAPTITFNINSGVVNIDPAATIIAGAKAPGGGGNSWTNASYTGIGTLPSIWGIQNVAFDLSGNFTASSSGYASTYHLPTSSVVTSTGKQFLGNMNIHYHSGGATYGNGTWIFSGSDNLIDGRFTMSGFGGNVYLETLKMTPNSVFDTTDYGGYITTLGAVPTFGFNTTGGTSTAKLRYGSLRTNNKIFQNTNSDIFFYFCSRFCCLIFRLNTENHQETYQ
jgi:hypothetical protein